MDQVAENYQLKWHSFGSYLHSCIATSFLNESFADVILVTTDGRQIMAHRFILSACSQYLNQILKLQPKLTPALPLVIVLPPDINYKTLKILIQYMYSGEATVSKDILEQVLKGGDILKVKGLWRPKEDEQTDERLVKVSQPREKINHTNKQLVNHSPNHQKENQPKVLNYSIMKTYDNTTTNHENQTTTESGESETESGTNITNKCSNQLQKQNSVIKRTDEEKQAESKEDENNSPNRIADTNTDDTLQFLVIKEEPIEWSEVNDSEMELIDEKDMFNSEMTIKPEIYIDEGDESTQLYSPLTCELCSETFALPADWVRHIQTHTDMLPAKRQRRGKNDQDELNDAPFPPLHCDLCQKYFPTPAEWVHHIQNTHTEFELHMSNKTPGKVFKPPRSLGPTQNTCVICNKKFPSHASLLIHKRTHTGEKPYMCEMCYKGFNVKSNLLRHLRTVHDKFINSTEVDKEETNVSS